MNITEEEFLRALEIVKKYREQCALYLNDINGVLNSVSESVVDLKHFHIRNTRIEKSDLSRMAKSGLSILADKKNISIEFVKDLALLTEKEVRSAKLIGVKKFEEIQSLCESAKIQMKY